MKAKLLLASGALIAVLLVSFSIITARIQHAPSRPVAVAVAVTAEIATAVATPTDTPPTPTLAPATQTPLPAPTDAPTSTAQPTATASPQPSPTDAPTPAPVASPTSAALPTAAATQASAPPPPRATGPTAIRRLRIPSIGVDAYIESVGLLQDGSMDVPHRWDDVAWYNLGYHIGDAGNAVIAGHLDSDVAPAVFWRLGDLSIGSHIYIDWDSATHLDFVVRDKKNYEADKAPIPLIYGPSSHPNLNLITCGGSWNRSAGAYDQRLVVYTTLADAGSAR